MAISRQSLLDLAFFEVDVLAHDGVVLLQRQLFGHGAGVLLGHVEEAGIRRGVEADLDGGWLGHVSKPSGQGPKGAPKLERGTYAWRLVSQRGLCHDVCDDK